MPVVNTFLPGNIAGETKIFFQCATCKAGMTTKISADNKKEIERQNFVPKPWDKAHFKTGEWIPNKACPNCFNNTVFKA